MRKSGKLNRRGMLKRSMAAAAASTFIPLDGISKNKGFNDNFITRENSKLGTTDWMITESDILYENDDPNKYLLHVGQIRSSAIEGYADKLYAKACEDINLHISTSTSEEFTIDVYRIGYYGGTGGRHIASYGPFQGQDHGTPNFDTSTFFIECDWPVSYTINIGEDWLSGYYVCKLRTVTSGRCNYIAFTVVDDRDCDIVFQISDLNSHCYQRWPLHHGLYNNTATLNDPVLLDNYWGNINTSSFKRPMAKLSQLVDQPLTLGTGEFFFLQYPFVYWMEKEGYDVSYNSGMYTHEGGVSTITRGKGFVVQGHDEYWTQDMFDSLFTARGLGVSMGFFAGNTVFGRLELSADGNGKPNQTFKRQGAFGNEQDLMGSGTGGGIIGGGNWRCMEPSHWMFNGTGMAMGSTIEGILGWEYHNEISTSIPGLIEMAHGETDFYGWPPDTPDGTHGYHRGTYYDVQGGNNFVVNTGSIWWVYGFEDPPGFKRATQYGARQTPDERVPQITKNILDEMINRG